MANRVTSRFWVVIVSACWPLLTWQYAVADQNTTSLGEPLTKIACPLQNEVCTVHIADQQFDLRLTPQGLPAMTTLQLEVIPKTSDVSGLSQFDAWFEGRDMDMGRQPLVLDKSVGDTRIIAHGMIPMCHMEASMVWQLKINLRYQNSDVHLLFEMASE